jgi:hypothetical protein
MVQIFHLVSRNCKYYPIYYKNIILSYNTSKTTRLYFLVYFRFVSINLNSRNYTDHKPEHNQPDSKETQPYVTPHQDNRDIRLKESINSYEPHHTGTDQLFIFSLSLAPKVIPLKLLLLETLVGAG